MKNFKSALFSFCLVLTANTFARQSAFSVQTERSVLPVIEAELTTAPNVPAPVVRDYPARIRIPMYHGK